jgi:lipoprotein-anchoring transpeptidase ErfK/SrfK
VNLYHDGVLLNSWLVRGGGASTPTRTGTFRVYYRDIDHVSSTFDSAPMPYSQFFSGGQALHGSRLMMDPYVGHSHGCVNFWTEDARQLWNLTSTKRLWVHVYGRWN